MKIIWFNQTLILIKYFFIKILNKLVIVRLLFRKLKMFLDKVYFWVFIYKKKKKKKVDIQINYYFMLKVL